MFQLIFPFWIGRLVRIAVLQELAPSVRFRKIFNIIVWGLVILYLPAVWSRLVETPAPLIYWGSFPSPFFKNILINIIICLLLSLLLNFMTARALAFLPIRERWQIACLRCGLLVPGIDDLTLKEIPDVIYADDRKFRILAKGLTAQMIEAKKAALSNAAGIFIWSAREARNEDGQLRVGVIEIYYTRRDLPTLVPLSEAPPPQWGSLNFGLGINGYEIVKLTEMIHAGIAGLPGSGKSVQLRSLIVQAMVIHPKAVCVGIDFKSGAEFHVFEKYGNFIMCDGFEKAALVLGEIYQEYLRRAELVKRREVENVYQIRGPNGERVNPIFIFGDEMAEMFYPLGKQADKALVEAQRKAVDYLSKLARLARFVGVHLILATQRPDAKAIDPQVRSMLKTRCAFKLSQKEDSILWLNRAAALELPDIPGRMLLATDSGVFEQLQALKVDKQEAKEMISHLEKGSSKLYQNINNKLNKILSEGVAASPARSSDALAEAPLRAEPDPILSNIGGVGHHQKGKK